MLKAVSRLRLLGLAFSMAACASKAPIFVALPEISALTVVIAHRASEEDPFVLEIFGPETPVVAEIDAESEAYLLHYASAPSELGLEPGGTARCTALLPAHKSRLESGRFEALVGPLPDALQRALVPEADRCAPCRPVEIVSVNYQELGTLRAGVWLDSGPLVAHLNGVFRRVDRDAATPITGCGVAAGSPDVVAMAALGDNRFLTGATDGSIEVVHFDDQATTCVVESSTVVGSVHADVPYPRIVAFGMGLFDADPEGRHAIVSDGRLLELGPSGPELIGMLPLNPLDQQSGGTQIAQLLRVDGQRALAIAGDNQIHWWTPAGVERVDEVELPFNQFSQDGGQRVTALVVDRTSGSERLVAGASSGLIFEWDEEIRRWSQILNAPQKKEIRGFEFLGDRWLLVIEQGDIVVWHPETGICDAPFRIPLATNSGNCYQRARRDRELVIFDAIGDNSRPAGTAWITEE